MTVNTLTQASWTCGILSRMPRYRFAVAEFLKSKGLDTAYKVTREMKKDSAQARRLVDPKRTQINIEIINDICAHFPECTPNDLIVKVEERATSQKTASHKTAKKR